MKCLSCNATLVTAEMDHVEIDYCPECTGIWLDQGELELLLGGASMSEQYLQSFVPVHGNKERPRNCLICRKKMGKVLCPGKTRIQIDQCPKGHGLWCDAGELRSILENADAGHPKVLQHLKTLFAFQPQGGSS